MAKNKKDKKLKKNKKIKLESKKLHAKTSDKYNFWTMYKLINFHRTAMTLTLVESGKTLHGKYIGFANMHKNFMLHLFS